MDRAARLSSMRLPVGTLLVCVTAAVAYGAAPLQAGLVYDRLAIGEGELWRLLTGNLVHHSGAHLVCNVAPFLIVGALLEIQRSRHFVALCLLAGALIGATLYAARPDLIVFGGLSGIVTALVVYLCLNGLDKGGAWRWLCVIGLVLLAVKIGAEFVSGASLLLSAGPQDFVPVPESHALGAAAALLVIMCNRFVSTRFWGRTKYSGT